MKPTTRCRVFVSRNSRDKEVSDTIRDQLRQLAGNLRFFDDNDIEAGQGWRARICRELKRANLLLLVLTKPSRNDFDWPLYEAGLFESLDAVDPRRVVCIYPDPDTSPRRGSKSGGPPSQIDDRQAVKATEEDILEKFLKPLFYDKKFTNTIEPLNENVEESTLRPLARKIADAINKVDVSVLSAVKYTNYYIQVLLPAELNSLEPGIEIESNDRSLQHLFGLSESAPSGQRWTWKDIAATLTEDGDGGEFNLRWATQLADAVSAMKAGRYFKQLSSMFLGADGRLYRPGIEICKKYENGRMTIDVSFWEQTQDSWLKTAQPPVALAAYLELASRIRYELIEPFLRRVNRWHTKSAKSNGCAQLAAMVENIEHYRHFIEQLTGGNLEEAFTSEEAEQHETLREEYQAEIKPRLEEAISSQAVPKLRKALQLWRKNNLLLLDIGLLRYQTILDLRKQTRSGRLREAPAHAA